MTTSELSGRLARLSLDKRALLERALLDRVNQGSRPEAGRRARGGSAPLSFTQRRLWFLSRWESGSPLYGLRAALRCEGRLDVGALGDAFATVVGRHEILRTTFAEVDGEPLQVIAPEAGRPLTVLDLRSLGPSGGRTAVRGLLESEAARPFDLARGPLLRAFLLLTADEEAVLSISLHHIVADGWSYALLARELSAAYTAAVAGRPVCMPALPLQYADYAMRQQHEFERASLRTQLDWWRDRLAGIPPLMSLPTDRPPPAVPGYQGDTVETRIEPEVAQRLKELGRREGATLFMTLLAAFQVVLHRHSGRTDIVVGSPVAGRTSGDVEEIIGCFINSLVLRNDLSGDPPFLKLLGLVKDNTLAAYAHQDAPFELLAAELRVGRDTSHSPIFQVLFALQNTAEPEWDLPGVELYPVSRSNPAVHLDLSVAVTDAPDGLSVILDYRTELFDRSTAERIADHYRTVLTGIADAPGVRIGDLPMSAPAERRRLLADWSVGLAPPGAPPWHAACELVGLFEAVVKRDPDAVAVVAGDARLSYAKLNERANRIAHLLRERGIGPDTRVCTAGDWSPWLVAAVLGVLKAGGAFVPVDPAHPSERLAHIRADAAVTLVLTERRWRERHGDAEVIVLDEDPRLDMQPCRNPGQVSVSQDDLAYVVYTSGSTGRPKGVGIPRRALAEYCAAVRARLGGDGLSFGLLAAPGTDLGHTALFPPLLYGGRLVLMPADCALEGRAFADAVARIPLDVLKTTPTQLRALLAQASPEEILPARWLVLGGESIPPALAAEVLSAGRCRLLSHYGPTEATVGCVTHVVAAPDWRVPIGRSLPGVTAYVLDAHQRLLPQGAVGELCVGGSQVARGYLGHPGLTAERFVPDPFAGDGERLYRTGDLARWRVDGVLEFLGRADQQVKVRGHRVELGEIEAVLLGHPAVSAAAVAATLTDAGDTRLVSYVVGDVNPDEVRSFLGGRLPSHMVPSALVPLEALPLTSNGKLDRAALPVPAFPGPATPGAAASLLDPVSELLHAIWCEVLGIERVAPEADFFTAGGHSLAALQVIARVRSTFGLDLPVRALFDTPTLAGFARQVKAAQRESPEPPPTALAILPVQRTGPVPLAHAQRRLWYIDQLDPGGCLHNVSTAVAVEGPLRPGDLFAAMDALRARHESLRTVFRQTLGVPEQVVLDEAHVSEPVVDLSGLDSEARERAVEVLAEAEARRGFDLGTGPLLRVVLLRLAPARHVLLVTLHHITTDAWSSELLFGELWELYEERGDEPVPLPVQFADYALWEQRCMSGEALAEAGTYWRRQLAGAPQLLELGCDGRRPMTAVYPSATLPFELSPRETRDLVDFGVREGVTLFMTVLAAYVIMLHRRSGESDILVGTDTANRDRLETERLIGFLTNQVVLRVGLSGDDSGRDVLSAVRETTLDAYAHQEMPFDLLVEALRPERHVNRPPLFQVEITFQRSADRLPAPPGLTISPRAMHSPVTTLDLSLHLIQTETVLRGGLTYNASVFTSATARRLLGQTLAILADLPGQADLAVRVLAARAEDRERVATASERASAARALFESTGRQNAR